MTNSPLDLVANRSWLITSDGLDTIMAVADRQDTVESLETRLGRKLDNTRTVTVRDGVAVIPVTGPVFRYANLLTEVSGATSTEVLATDIRTALDDPAITAIVLNIDSPGGEATGINELGEMIYAARGKKTIKAYAGGMVASAAYWFASAAEEIITDDTAQLGSVGVVLSLRKRDDRPGEQSYEIVSQNAPNKRPDPETDTGRAQLQTRTDELAGVFLDKVARNRGIDRAKVNNRFRQGGIATGAIAVKAGMADRLGSLEGLIAELAGAETSRPTTRRNRMTTVHNTQELQAALATGIDPRTLEVAPRKSVDVQNTRQAATAIERRRCQDIWHLAGHDHRAMAIKAIDAGMSVEALGLQLLKEKRDTDQRGAAVSAISKRWQGDQQQATSKVRQPESNQSAAVTAITDQFHRR